MDTKNTKKDYSLIVSGDNSFSLICDADQDGMTDYFPGIWCLKTQKSALMFARKELERGNTVEVRNYDNPSNYALSNKLIKALGTGQTLFAETAAPVSALVIKAGIPSNLSQLKKFLVVGKKIKISNFRYDDSKTLMPMTRDTVVIKVQTNAVVLAKTGTEVIGASPSWLDLGKATDWAFDNFGATKCYIDRDGKLIPSSKIEYA